MMLALITEFLKSRLNSDDFNHSVRLSTIISLITKDLNDVNKDVVMASAYLLDSCWIDHEKTVDNIQLMAQLSCKKTMRLLGSMKISKKTIDELCSTMEKSGSPNNDTAEQQVLFEARLIDKIGASGLYYWGKVLGFEKYYSMLSKTIDDADSFILSDNGKKIAEKRIHFSKILIDSFKNEMEVSGFRVQV